jgi:nitroreductase/FMN reductase [NAD(P)H]
LDHTNTPSLQETVSARYSDAPETLADTPDLLASMLTRGSCRSFDPKPVPTPVLDMLCAATMAAPTKSDLQQRDIIALQDPAKRAALAGLVTGQDWVAQAPLLLIFCGNNRRQRHLHDWHGVPFANDHLDAFFNAVADAAIALSAFVTAAEALGLGCCPISALRNEARAVSELVGLPAHVFPVAGLALGYPKTAPRLSMRLPLRVTCHTDQYQETNLKSDITNYDRTRAAAQPFRAQRATDRFGEKEDYGWSDDKVRQYATPERADFGAYIRAQGFCLD